MNSFTYMIYDPIPFNGGSKIATRHMLEQLPNTTTCHILTADIASWHRFRTQTSATTQASVSKQTSASKQTLNNRKLILHELKCPASLYQSTQGVMYWMSQLIFLCQIAFVWSLASLRSTSPLSKLILISGPGIDMAGYLFAQVTRLFKAIPIIQFIHGPVFGSRAVAWCLKQGHTTFYLDSSKNYISRLLGLEDDKPLPHHFHTFINGIPASQWPTSNGSSQNKQTQQNRRSVNSPTHNRSRARPTLFWAASLLKWKGLDHFIEAHQTADLSNKAITKICYIKPQNSTLEQSNAPVQRLNIVWFEAPENIDDIRATADIFVSTSQSEPFGMSVLESLAAGLLVVIPKDGAYWDQVLTHHVNCIKYDISDESALAKTLAEVVKSIEQLRPIANQGRLVADRYRANITYSSIVEALLNQDPASQRSATLNSTKQGSTKHNATKQSSTKQDATKEEVA
ncbi:glycosyltransferase family 4 protein [Vibrio alfacsensis]|uniref:glycosyltransferase family 4 protein n=1 Tax=Vibrio alfacsensis TaxID=1074311 RepID=UPI001BEFA195|nr:glycosyltransferase family 4 protein [Vibrio alfacsensis]BCN24111.1 glycosyl transferase [Vibrio alfacsensis]